MICPLVSVPPDVRAGAPDKVIEQMGKFHPELCLLTLFEAINVSMRGQDPGPELRQWVGCLNFEDEVMIFNFPVQSDLWSPV